ncbi:hypothetical protein [Oceanimonas smirnovii]|nr:hypothetical protein [Oceanimonas smirnovii]
MYDIAMVNMVDAAKYKIIHPVGGCLCDGVHSIETGLAVRVR